MSRDQLQEFLHQKKASHQPPETDWAARRDQWVAALAGLFNRIEKDFLGESGGDVEIVRDRVSITESFIGTYEVPSLSLRVGDESVTFAPKGVNIVGAQGRVDVRGERGDRTLIWRGGNRWEFVLSRSPQLRCEELSTASLTEVLRAIMRP